MTDSLAKEQATDSGVYSSQIQKLGKCQLAPTSQVAPSGITELADKLAQIDPWKKMGISGKGLAEYLSHLDPGGHKFLVEFDDGYVGAVVIRYPWLRGPYLEFLGLTPSAQGSGIGATILEWMETEARRKNQRNLWVLTSTFNHDALRFYQRFGFERMGDVPDLVADGFDEVFLRKKL